MLRRKIHRIWPLILAGGLFAATLGAQSQISIEGVITRIQEEQGLLTINGQVLDARDFELEDLKVGDVIMGEAIKENGSLRLIDLEVIKKK
jgi:hypothetical protein